MIYQLNDTTHWQLSPELMRELIRMVDHWQEADEASTDMLIIELCNFRSALECELARIPKPPADNSDLI